MVTENESYFYNLYIRKHHNLEVGVPVLGDTVILMTTADLFRLYSNEGYWQLYPRVESFFEEVLKGNITNFRSVIKGSREYDVRIIGVNQSILKLYSDKGISEVISIYLDDRLEGVLELNVSEMNKEDIGAIIYIMTLNKYYIVKDEENMKYYFDSQSAPD